MGDYTRLQVMANIETLPYRSGPNSIHPIEGYYKRGDAFLSSDQTVDLEGILWVQNADTKFWSMFRSGRQTFLKVVPLPKLAVAKSAATENSRTSKARKSQREEIKLEKKTTNRSTKNTVLVDTWNYKQTEQFMQQASEKISMDKVNEWNYHMTEQYASQKTTAKKTTSTQKTTPQNTYIGDPEATAVDPVTPTIVSSGVTKVMERKPVFTSSRIDKPTISELALSRVVRAATGAVQSNILSLEKEKNPIAASGTPQKSRIPQDHSDGQDIEFDNGNAYPKKRGKDRQGEYQYDWSMDTTQLDAQVDLIRKNLNIPSLYNIQQINRLMHTQFNRYKIAYPDFERNALIPYVFMTRPDLNLYESDGKTILNQFYAVPSLQYLIEAYPMTAKTLTMDFDATHDFNPLLCNRIASLDVQDDVLEVGETGETFTGYKSQYARHNIKGRTAGSFSIKFPETFNMAITILHQIWCTYMSCVYRGSLEPKGKYIGRKILDYAVDIYYFLCDRDNIIRFWTKYYGCFPSNVNKSMLSYDAGSLITFPESSITYNYITKDEDMSPETISEFNDNSHITQRVQPYAKDYDKVYGHYGPTWCGAPFITEVMCDEGDGKLVKRFAMRHKPAPEDALISAAIPQSAITSGLNLSSLAAESLNTAASLT